MYLFEGKLLDQSPEVKYLPEFGAGKILFTSLLLDHGEVFSLEEHEKRLEENYFLFFREPIKLDLKEDLCLLPANKIYKVKINLLPYDKKVKLLYEVKELSIISEPLEVESIKLSLNFEKDLTNLKYSNYALSEYMIASKGHPNLLKVNQQDQIDELIYSNVFFFKGSVFYLPKGNFLHGIGLKLLKEFFVENKIEYVEEIISLRNIKEFERAFSINSVRLINEIRSIDSNQFEIGEFQILKSFKEFINNKKVKIC